MALWCQQKIELLADAVPIVKAALGYNWAAANRRRQGLPAREATALKNTTRSGWGLEPHPIPWFHCGVSKLPPYEIKWCIPGFSLVSFQKCRTRTFTTSIKKWITPAPPLRSTSPCSCLYSVLFRPHWSSDNLLWLLLVFFCVDSHTDHPLLPERGLSPTYQASLPGLYFPDLGHSL